MIEVVPGETAVTSPLEDTVAIPGFEDCQGFAAGVEVPINVTVLPIQADNGPVIAGAGLILTIKLLEFTMLHPELCTTALK